MRKMSLTALFTALGAEVMSRSEDAFELDKLSTLIPSQEFTVLFLPLTSIWRLSKKKGKKKDFKQRNSFKIIEILVSIV